MPKSDERFGRRTEPRLGDGSDRPHAEPRLSFNADDRDLNDREPRNLDQRSHPRSPRDERLVADEERPIYLEQEAKDQKSSRAWIGIAAIAFLAGFGVYGWHLYTQPVTVEPMPLPDAASNPAPQDKATPLDNTATTPSPGDTAPPASQ